MLLINQGKALSSIKKRRIKSAIDKGKLGLKWTHGRVDKANDEIINKA